MQPIPKPHILDPNRVLDNRRGDFTADHKARAELLEAALQETCAYAQHLWDDLDSMRKYLIDSLPSDPRMPAPHRASATPSGPDDDQGWQNWIDAFAEVTSVLCGPKGDSGFGLGRARQEAQLRRDAPSLRIAADQARQFTIPPEQPPVNDIAEPRRQIQAPTQPPTRHLARGIATTILAMLALRGLRHRRLAT